MLHVEGRWLNVGEDSLEVIVYPSHNDEDARRYAQGLINLRNHHIDELNCENVIFHLGEVAEDADLAEHALAALELVECAADVLDSDGRVLIFRKGLDDLAEGAFSLL